MDIQTFIDTFEPCSDARDYLATQPDLVSAWANCDRLDWMRWVVTRMDGALDNKLRLFACACVRYTPLHDGRLVWDLLTDDRSRNAVEVAEKYANGEATLAELRTAATAADAAYTAAYAAAYTAADDAAAAAATAYAATAADDAYTAATAAARKKAHARQRDLMREIIPFDVLLAALNEAAGVHE